MKTAWLLILTGMLPHLLAAEELRPPLEGREDQIREAAARALPLLARAAAGSADHRKCFTCHSQAMPVLAVAAAARRGIEPDRENLRRQVEHTYAHLQRGKENYAKGKGQGGGIDTAGYALWTLETGAAAAGEAPPADEVTAAVVSYLLKKQQRQGHWTTSSRRPPSEASDFTATFLALRALGAFGPSTGQDEIDAARLQAAKWLQQAEAKDTEDHVFRLLAINYLRPGSPPAAAAAADLRSRQRDDGGWAQTDDLESDAYATGTALYALGQAGLPADDPAYQRGIDFLLSDQRDDGSWHVASRSKPFQTYFETGFPHGKDQFISTSATAWAVIALLGNVRQRPAAL